MTEFQIALPPEAANYVEGQIAAGRFKTASEVVLAAIDAQRVAEARRRLAALIQEGIDSGEAVEVTDEWWDRFDEKIEAERRRRQSA
jgi:antitoxin ParD1/3/4